MMGDDRPDLCSEEARREAAVALTRLFERWGLSAPQRLALLGLPPERGDLLDAFTRGEPLSEHDELLDRVAYLFDIQHQLHELFAGHPRGQDGWMQDRIDALGHQTPLEIVEHDGLPGLQLLHTYVIRTRARRQPV